MSRVIEDYYTDAPNAYSLLYNGYTYKATGQSFQATKGGKLTQVTFKFTKGGSPTGNAYAKLYEHSGTYGTSSIGTGEALAVSAAVDISGASAGDLTFTFPTPYKLTKGGYYVLAIEYTGGDDSNKIHVLQVGTLHSHGGVAVRQLAATSAWVAQNNRDTYFIVYSNLNKNKRILYASGGMNINRAYN